MSYLPVQIINNFFTSRLSSVLPPAVAPASVIGVATNVARSDHTHDRITVAKNGLLTDASGVVTFTFGRTFDLKPNVFAVLEENNTATQPVTWKVLSYGQDVNSKYISVQIQGQRARTLPASILNVLSLQLFAIFTNAAANVSVQCTALPVTP